MQLLKFDSVLHYAIWKWDKIILPWLINSFITTGQIFDIDDKYNPSWYNDFTSNKQTKVLIISTIGII